MSSRRRILEDPRCCCRELAESGRHETEPDNREADGSGQQFETIGLQAPPRRGALFFSQTGRTPAGSGVRVGSRHLPIYDSTAA